MQTVQFVFFVFIVDLLIIKQRIRRHLQETFDWHYSARAGLDLWLNCLNEKKKLMVADPVVEIQSVDAGERCESTVTRPQPPTRWPAHAVTGVWRRVRHATERWGTSRLNLYWVACYRLLMTTDESIVDIRCQVSFDWQLTTLCIALL